MTPAVVSKGGGEGSAGGAVAGLLGGTSFHSGCASACSLSIAAQHSRVPKQLPLQGGRQAVHSHGRCSATTCVMVEHCNFEMGKPFIDKTGDAELKEK